MIYYYDIVNNDRKIGFYKKYKIIKKYKIL